jgi:hypothetical protein
MKKNILLLSVLILTIFSIKDIRAEESSVPLADREYNMQDAGLSPEGAPQQEQREMRSGGDMEKKKGMMGKGMMPHQPTVVATSDGGVVVLDGPRLIKYDSQLTLVGEAELKPGKKRTQIKKEEAAPVAEQAPVTDEPAIELPAVENPS